MSLDAPTRLVTRVGGAPPGERRVYDIVGGSFEAPPGDYDWLNAVQTFGLGTPTADGVRYPFYRLR